MGAEHLSELMPLRISTLCSPAPETFLTPPSTTPRRKPAGVDRGEWGGDARGSPPFCTSSQRAAQTEPARQPPCNPIT